MALSSKGTARWHWIPFLAAGLYAVVTIAAAIRETPTVDEFAHVPAGTVHWRQQRLDLYRNNPPLGKMWVAAPVALDPSVQIPQFDGTGVGWEPWAYADVFQQVNSKKYLSLMTRARLMTVPLGLLAGWMVYVWTRSLFGPFAGAMSATLLLLSPTLIAHGHLATVDVASMTTFFGAVLALRWATQPPSWQRYALAGIVLGLALSIKFSALLLVVLAPVLLVILHQREPDQTVRHAGRTILGRLAVYALATWLTVNALMGFAGTFTQVSELDLQSTSVSRAMGWLPGWLPILLPLDYMRGIDALQADVESVRFPGYLHGQWSSEGWRRYYLVAFALKESEPVVLLTLLALPAIFLVRPPTREMLMLLAPTAAFCFAAALSPLCLGIRYILPVFPFLFVCMGACFAWAETRLSAPVDQATKKKKSHGRKAAIRSRGWDRRYWLIVPLVGYQTILVVATFPAYLSYFNGFAGGSRQGSRWLIDSNLDWGQDLYRLPVLAERYGIDRLQLMYFGHARPELYGIEYQIPEHLPVAGVYVVSVNYWKGMKYAHLDQEGSPRYLSQRVAWMSRLVPTELVGSLAIFDLRESTLSLKPTLQTKYNMGVLALRQGASDRALSLLDDVVRQCPDWAEPYYFLGLTQAELGQARQAIASYRKAVVLDPQWAEAMNNLAWHLATSPDDSLRNGAEAERWATEACRLTADKDIGYLDTLAAALAESGNFEQAVAVSQRALKHAEERNLPELAETLRQSMLRYQVGQPTRDPM